MGFGQIRIPHQLSILGQEQYSSKSGGICRLRDRGDVGGGMVEERGGVGLEAGCGGGGAG
jgi:hypothetical protein